MHSSLNKREPRSLEPLSRSAATFRLVVAAGLEPAALLELQRHELTGEAAGPGAVRVTTPIDRGAELALSLRTCARLVWLIAEQLPDHSTRYFDAVAALPWPELLSGAHRFAVRVSGTSETLAQPLYTARVTKDAIRACFDSHHRAAPPVDPRQPEVWVDVRIDRTGAAVGLVLGTESLHRRGFERRTAAPLREDIAAGLALLAGVDAAQPLLDPFCGSATLLAEATLVALEIPPERPEVEQTLARLPAFAAIDLSAVKHRLTQRRRRSAAPRIGFDADGAQLEHARRLIAAAGLSDEVELRRGEVPQLDLPAALAPGLVLTNPPWGRWLKAGAEQAWDGLGTLMKRHLEGWRLAALSGSKDASRALRLKAHRKYPIRIGSVDARLLLYTIHGS